LCNFLHSPATSSLLGPNILLRTLFSNTLSLCSSLSVRDQVSHPYKTTGRIMVLYILTFTFLDSRRDDKRSEPNGSKHSLCRESWHISYSQNFLFKFSKSYMKGLFRNSCDTKLSLTVSCNYCFVGTLS
jgi:hypothetical protein